MYLPIKRVLTVKNSSCVSRVLVLLGAKGDFRLMSDIDSGLSIGPFECPSAQVPQEPWLIGVR